MSEYVTWEESLLINDSQMILRDSAGAQIGRIYLAGPWWQVEFKGQTMCAKPDKKNAMKTLEDLYFAEPKGVRHSA